MGIWQIIWICLVVSELTMVLIKNGQKKEGEYSFGLTLVAVIMNFLILYMGGFFNQ